MSDTNTDWGVFERDNPYQVHVVPVDDSRLHELRDGCCCLPLCRQIGFSRPLYIHHAFDCRMTEDAETVM